MINQSSAPCFNDALYSDYGTVNVASCITVDFFRTVVSVCMCRMIVRDFTPVLKNKKLVVYCFFSVLLLPVLDR